MPLGILRSDNLSSSCFPSTAQDVVRVARSEGAEQIVLGIPLNRTGGDGEQANITRQFAQVLAHAAFPTPVFMWDERYSSAEAASRMNFGTGAAPGAPLDAVAAAVILEDFFAGDVTSAVHIDSGRRRAPVRRGVNATRPAQPPPSYSQVRQQMIARAAKAAQARGGNGKKKKR